MAILDNLDAKIFFAAQPLLAAILKTSLITKISIMAVPNHASTHERFFEMTRYFLYDRPE